MEILNYVLKHCLYQGMNIIRLNTFSLQFYIHIYKLKKNKRKHLITSH